MEKLEGGEIGNLNDATITTAGASYFSSTTLRSSLSALAAKKSATQTTNIDLCLISVGSIAEQAENASSAAVIRACGFC